MMSRPGDENVCGIDGCVEIFTDGACKGNPGPGGWAALLRYKGVTKVISGSESWTTNNRMELMAAIRALETLKKSCRVRLVTDSQYLKLGITQWLKGWKRRGWQTTDKKAVKNEDLWRRLDELTTHHTIEWLWTRGHEGQEENELVDKEARKALHKLLTGQQSIQRS